MDTFGYSSWICWEFMSLSSWISSRCLLGEIKGSRIIFAIMGSVMEHWFKRKAAKAWKVEDKEERDCEGDLLWRFSTLKTEEPGHGHYCNPLCLSLWWLSLRHEEHKERLPSWHEAECQVDAQQESSVLSFTCSCHNSFEQSHQAALCLWQTFNITVFQFRSTLILLRLTALISSIGWGNTIDQTCVQEHIGITMGKKGREKDQIKKISLTE